MNIDVISFGSAIVDIFLRSKDFSWENLPENEKVEVEERKISSGGGGTNTAVSFSRQGLSSAAVCRFGNDVFGRFIIDELKKEEVNTDFLVQKDEETDTSIILLGPNAERKILVCRGDTRLDVDNIRWEELKAKWFYITSLEGNLVLAAELINHAEKNNIQVSWNPGNKELENKEKVKRLAGQVQVFNLNRREMEDLVEKDLEDESFWQTVRELGIPLTVVTDGRQGAYLLHDNGLHFLPSPKTQPVDETGAGDAFGSGFAAGLIKGLDEKEAFDLAMKNGASVVQHIGAKKGLLKNPKVQNFNTQN